MPRYEVTMVKMEESFCFPILWLGDLEIIFTVNRFEVQCLFESNIRPFGELNFA